MTCEISNYNLFVLAFLKPKIKECLQWKWDDMTLTGAFVTVG